MIRMVKTDYLERFSSRFPDELSGERKIGTAIEFPVIDSETFKAMDTRTLFRSLVEKDDGWNPIKKDASAGCHRDGIILSPSLGVCTLKVSLPPVGSLYQVKNSLDKAVRTASSELDSNGGAMLGYGIQPLTTASSNLWVERGKVKAFRGNIPTFFNSTAITAASRIRLDATNQEIIAASNVFNCLAPIAVALFANSPVWKGSIDHYRRRTVREDLLKEWNHCGQRAGMILFFDGAEDYLNYIYGLPLLAAKDPAGRYFPPRQSFGSWVAQNAAGADDFMGILNLQEDGLWAFAKPETQYGTVEIVPACSQPPGSEILPFAFCLGIMENLAEASNLVKLYRWKDWNRLYQEAMVTGFDAKTRRITLDSIAEQVLMIAQKGLERRCMGEEELLAEAFSRLYRRQAPAEKVVQWMDEGGIEKIMKKTAC